MRSRSTLSVLIALAILASLFGGTKNAHAAGFPIERTLYLGMSGEDVRELQKILNRDPATSILAPGAGSPGQETPYFGLKTQDAVIRFQEKHRIELLAPLGLTAGTGIVGPSTRRVLASLDGIIAPIASAAGPGASTNPNLQNLDKFLDSVDRVSTKEGLSPAAVSALKEQIVKDAATTTDLRKTFTDLVAKNNKPAATADDSVFGKALALISGALQKAFAPAPAEAATSIPFGGALLYSYFCTCSYTWLLTIQPLPPSYAALLTYTPFSQAYLSYNIPATTELLGNYTSGGTCAIYIGYGCATIPSEGMITPTVGSSLR